MTNDELQKKYGAIFPVHILYNDNGKTILAGTQHRPPDGKSCFAYAPMLDDFIKVSAEKIVSIIRVIKIKSKS